MRSNLRLFLIVFKALRSLAGSGPCVLIVIASVMNLSLAAFAQLTAEDETKPTFIVPLNETGGMDQPLRILVYGDMRFTDPSNKTDTEPRVRAWLARKVAEEKPDAMLVTGDIPFPEGDCGMVAKPPARLSHGRES